MKAIYNRMSLKSKELGNVYSFKELFSVTSENNNDI